MMRAACLVAVILLSQVGFTSAQDKVTRDELRYDGKPFAFWETFPRTELKAEKRIDALRAMAAFGARGYAKEAAAVIVDMLADYDNDSEALGYFEPAPERWTPDQRLIHEAIGALRKIGPDASPSVLARLDRGATQHVASKLYAHYGSSVGVSESAVSILVGWLPSKVDQVPYLAVQILARALDQAKEKHQTAFVQSVDNAKNAPAIVKALADNLPTSAPLLGALGPRAKSAISALVRFELQPGDYANPVAAALAEIKPTRDERIAGLLLELKEKSDYYSRASVAATKLAEFGADARVALPDLLTHIKMPMPDLDKYGQSHVRIKERMTVIDAYVKIVGTKEALIIVNGLLEKNTVPQIERELMQVFLKLETDPKRAVALLVKSMERLPKGMLTGYYTGVPYQGPFGQFLDLTQALGERGEYAASAVPLLLKRYDDVNSDGALAIVMTLEKIGPPAREALPLLSKILQSEILHLRQAAAKAVQAIANK